MFTIIGVTTAQVYAEQSADRDTVPSADVTITVLSTFGRPIEGAQITLTNIGPQQEFHSQGGAATLQGVPYGLYQLEVRLNGFLPRQERIRIYQTKLQLQIGLELAPIHGYQQPEVVGSVEGATRTDKLWVRLIGLFTNDLVENRVDTSKKFRLVGMPAGRYVLLLFERGTLITAQQLDVNEGLTSAKLNMR